MRADAPVSAEGFAAWMAASGEGVWRYSAVVSPAGGGMICTGLDMGAALALARASGPVDAERVMPLLKAIEAGRIEGQARLAEQGRG